MSEFTTERVVAALKTVFDFRSPRSWLAALGFYLFYMMIGMVIAIIVSLIAWAVSGVRDPAEVQKISKFVGTISWAIYTTGMYGWILHHKNFWKEPLPLLGLVLTPVLSLVGSIFGLIPSAIIIVMEPEWRRGDRIGR